MTVRFTPLVKCEGFNREPCDTLFEPSRGRLCAACSNRVQQIRGIKKEQRERKQARRSS